MPKYCINRYKHPKMCEKTVDGCLPALKFVSDWFVTLKMFKDLDNAVFFNNI